jgi:hypothetical protein
MATLTTYPGTLNLPAIVVGDSYSYTLTWSVNGSSVNLTGYSAVLNLVNSKNGVQLLQLTSSSGLTLGGSAGTITIALTSAQSAELTPAPANSSYSLQLTSSGGSTVTTLVAGTWPIGSLPTSP